MSKPYRVALVGGPDVDARLDLMRILARDFEVVAYGSSPDLARAFGAQGFEYHWYPLSRRVNPFADLRTITHLRSHFRRQQPDIVHTFDTKPGVWGCIAARLARVPVIVGTVTGLGSLYTGGGLKVRALRRTYQMLQRIACRAAHLTIFQNRDDARQLVAAGVVPEAKTAVILGSGVATDDYAPERVGAAERARLRQELGIRADETVVAMIARVTRTKGVLEFMAAARAVAGRQPSTRFLLVGPEDTDSLDRLGAAELAELRRTVTWPGRRRDIAAVLAITDVFVLPSAYREGIPRVLLEAAAMGLPLITTDSPGCNEVVEQDRNGCLVPTGDVPALTAAIERLVAQPALRRRFGAESRQRAVTRFALAVIAEQTRATYRRLLERHAPASRGDRASGRR